MISSEEFRKVCEKGGKIWMVESNATIKAKRPREYEATWVREKKEWRIEVGFEDHMYVQAERCFLTKGEATSWLKAELTKIMRRLK